MVHDHHSLATEQQSEYYDTPDRIDSEEPDDGFWPSFRRCLVGR